MPVHSNPLISRMLDENAFSEKELKRFYRELCKETHPDTGKGSHEDFILLQKEMDEAGVFLKNFLSGNSASNKNITGTLADNPRTEFFRHLFRYTMKGLHSMKTRLKPGLKDANAAIILDVLSAAHRYDLEFYYALKDYQQPIIFTLSPENSETLKMFDSAKRQFLAGLNWFFDYQMNGEEKEKRIALSFFTDASQLFEETVTPYSKIFIRLCGCLIRELSQPPVLESLA